MRLLLFLVLFSFGAVKAQKFSGCWTGILVNPAKDSSFALPVCLSHQIVLNFSNGVFRIEDSTGIIQYEVSGAVKDKKNFNLQSAKKPNLQSKGSKSSPFSFQFKYDDSSGYVHSTLNAPGSSYDGFQIYLERDLKTYEFSEKKLFAAGFTKRFLYNINHDIPSSERRNKELADFEFTPIYFAYDKYQLDSVYQLYLNRVARIIKSHSDLRIKIIGNTDGDGSNEYNLTLSKNRATCVHQYLVSKGVSTDRIVIEYRGESNPIDRNDTEEGKKRNRRVDIQFI